MLLLLAWMEVMLLLHMVVLLHVSLAAAAVRVPREGGQIAGVPGGPPGPAAEMLHALTSNIWTLREGSRQPSAHCGSCSADDDGTTRSYRLRRWR